MYSRDASTQNCKEVKQFLGLIGYYCKFIPIFSDLAQALNASTRKNVSFEWTPICQESFKLLKTSLMTEPILTYPDPNLPYVLFTDASKYAWACVLTQEKTHKIEEIEVKILHPITYMSGLFWGSQLNWACLTKEAYAIYMSIKKLSYYLEDTDITLRSDYLPLKKFLVKNTLNSKVNNWAIEISPFHITFKYIKGIKNTLADTKSRLINIDPQVQQDSEPEGYEFGYYMFDTLPMLEVSSIETTQDTSVCVNDNNDANNNLLELPIDKDTLFQLQQKDWFCVNILAQIEKGNIIEGQLYVIQDKLLKRYVVDGDNTYETIVLPRALIAQILKIALHNLGHNGTHRAYTLLKRLYYWKGLKPCVRKHIHRCISSFSIYRTLNYFGSWQAFTAQHGHFIRSVWENVMPYNIKRKNILYNIIFLLCNFQLILIDLVRLMNNCTDVIVHYRFYLFFFWNWRSEIQMYPVDSKHLRILMAQQHQMPNHRF